MDLYEVIKRPLVTERTSDLIEKGVYTFEVDREANKVQIAEAVEKIFKVGVVSVNTLRMHSKERGRGRFRSYTTISKKAVVRLKAGDKIEIFEGA